MYLMHTATPRALGYFLRSSRKSSFLAQMVYKTKGQVLFFLLFFSSQHLLTTVENRGQLRTKKKSVDYTPSPCFTATMSGIISLKVRREREREKHKIHASPFYAGQKLVQSHVLLGLFAPAY